MDKPEGWLPLAACVRGHAYRLHSRNLTVGVFDGTTGFIGIREKFGSRYLFREYHFDTGGSFGTARPFDDLGAVPDGIPIAESLGSLDHRNKRPVAFDRPVSAGGHGWYYTDSGAADAEIEPQELSNKRLFDWLQTLERRLPAQDSTTA